MTPPGQGLWIDPGFGASGDMILGALGGLVDDPDAALEPLRSLGVDGWSVRFGSADRNGLHASRAEVDAPAGTHGRRWSEIDRMIDEASLSPFVAAGARSTFRRLGEIEAAAHGVTIDEVHFHEVGAVDAIVDIVGSWLLLDALDIDANRITCGPVGLGHGTVRSAHGLLPVPAPATLALLTDWPTRPVDVEAETCTPTGAALLTTIASGPGRLPAGVITATSRGAGGRNPDTHPNVITAVTFEPDEGRASSAGIGVVGTAVAGADVVGTDSMGSAAVIVETNVDDVTAEVIGYVIERALALGADDAWATPIVMKKSRPATQIRILATPDHESTMRELLSRETGTLGTRVLPVTKHPLARRHESVTLRGHEIRIKVGPHGAKPEFDDLADLASDTGVPLRDLAAEAMAAWVKTETTPPRGGHAG